MRFLTVLLFFVSVAHAQSFYSISEKNIKGTDFKMSELKGKVVLIVNIASQCGYTKQLSGLESLYRKYQKQGLVVLGVPTNDFGGQTPEEDGEMLEFCQRTYDVTFPVLSKKTIKGKEQRPLYQFLTKEGPKETRGDIGWNFEKFLISKEGKVLAKYKSSVEPSDKELIKKLEEALAQ